MAPLSAHAAPVELEQPPSGRVTAQYLQILALVHEGCATNLAEEVKGLLGLPCLCVIDIHEIRLLGRDQHTLP